MNELGTIVAQHGVDVFVQHTHTLIAVIEADNRLSTWNPAFEFAAKDLSAKNKLEDFLVCESQDLYKELLNLARWNNKRTQGVLGFVSETEENLTRYNCIFTPLSDMRAMFLAEPAIYDPSLPEKYFRLTKLVNQLRVDYDQVKRILIKKQAEIEAVVAQADEVSHTDQLTSLPNRRQALIDLQREILHSDRYRTPFTISILDVDHFKKVNDNYGHAAGDDVLRHVADVLREHARHPDIATRFGGEEFLILLPNSDKSAAVKQATRLCEYLRKTPCKSGGREIYVTASIGIAQYDGRPELWRNLLQRADAALYQAKHNGRNGYVISD